MHQIKRGALAHLLVHLPGPRGEPEADSASDVGEEEAEVGL